MERTRKSPIKSSGVVNETTYKTGVPKSNPTLSGIGEPLDLEQIEIPDDDWEVPNAEEWARDYRRYKSFKLPGSDENYTTGDFVFIMPSSEENKRVAKKRKTETAEDNPWWIGKVTEVRAKDVKNVWMIILWMFTTVAQLEDAGAKKIPKETLHREVFLSDFEEMLPVHVVADQATIKLFDETDAVADPIEPTALWYRSQLLQGKDVPQVANKRKRRASKSKGPPPPRITPLHPPSCICKQGYRPHPYDRDPMVYCPADGCRKWYHTDCLTLAKQHISTITPEITEQIATSGSSLFPLDVAGTEDLTSDKPVRTIPSAIVNAASSSIIRGTTSTGIVGNGQQVLRARRILELSRKKKSGEMAKDKELQFSVQVWNDKAETQTVEKSSEHWTCPECAAVI